MTMLALITATRDSMATLPDCLDSVGEVRDRMKLIFVDGGSVDGTREYLENYAARNTNASLVPQIGTGLYEALNQGIQVALDDVSVTHIGMLHSDDRVIPRSFEKYLSVIETETSPFFYSDIEFHDRSGKTVRKWKSGEFSNFKLNTGWMPPHTSMVVAKDVYRSIGLYNPAFGTAADYDWIVRVLSAHGERSRYFPDKTLSMLVGGASSSSLKARLRANAMDGKVWGNQSRLQSVIIRACKPLRKMGQFFVHKES